MSGLSIKQQTPAISCIVQKLHGFNLFIIQELANEISEITPKIPKMYVLF